MRLVRLFGFLTCVVLAVVPAIARATWLPAYVWRQAEVTQVARVKRMPALGQIIYYGLGSMASISDTDHRVLWSRTVGPSVTPMGFSQDCSITAFRNGDSIEGRNTLTGAVVWTHPATAGFTSSDFNPEHNLLVVGHVDSFVSTGEVIDMVTGAHVCTLKPTGINLYNAKFSPDGNTVALSNSDYIMTFDTHTGLNTHIILTLNKVSSLLAWSGDGRYIGCKQFPGGVTVTGLYRSDGTFDKEIPYGGFTMALSPAATKVTMGDAGSMRTYDISSGTLLGTWPQFAGAAAMEYLDEDTVLGCGNSPFACTAVSGLPVWGTDLSFRALEIPCNLATDRFYSEGRAGFGLRRESDGSLVQAFPQVIGRSNMSGDGRFVYAFGSTGGAYDLRVYDAKTYALLRTVPLGTVVPRRVNSNYDGSKICVVDQIKVRMFDPNGSLLWSKSFNDPRYGLFSKTPEVLLVWASSQGIYVLNSSTGAVISNWIPNPGLTDIVFTPNGSRVYGWSYLGTLSCYTQAGALVYSKSFPNDYYTASTVSPSGQYWATICCKTATPNLEYAVAIWRASDGFKLAEWDQGVSLGVELGGHGGGLGFCGNDRTLLISAYGTFTKINLPFAPGMTSANGIHP